MNQRIWEPYIFNQTRLIVFIRIFTGHKQLPATVGMVLREPRKRARLFFAKLSWCVSTLKMARLAVFCHLVCPTYCVFGSCSRGFRVAASSKKPRDATGTPQVCESLLASCFQVQLASGCKRLWCWELLRQMDTAFVPASNRMIRKDPEGQRNELLVFANFLITLFWAHLLRNVRDPQRLWNQLWPSQSAQSDVDHRRKTSLQGKFQGVCLSVQDCRILLKDRCFGLHLVSLKLNSYEKTELFGFGMGCCALLWTTIFYVVADGQSSTLHFVIRDSGYSWLFQVNRSANGFFPKSHIKKGNQRSIFQPGTAWDEALFCQC